MAKKYWWIGLATILVLLVALLGWGLFWASDPHTIPSPLVGKPAPGFTFQPYPAGKAQIFQPGQPIVVNFWASWCVPCVEEAYELKKAHQTFGSKLIIYALAISDTSVAVNKFVKDYGVNYPIALDSGNHISLDYGVTGVPETFLIAKDGKIAKKITGVVHFSDIAAYIDNFNAP